MRRQELQSHVGVFALEGVDAYRANRKPDRAREDSIFFSSLYPVNPIRSDTLLLNENGV